MEENIMLLCFVTFITYFVVANPYTYAVVSKVSGLKLKNKTHHMILVGIHSIVMTTLMYVAFTMLVQDKECPPPPPVEDCPVCGEEEDSVDDAEEDSEAESGEDSNDDSNEDSANTAGSELLGNTDGNVVEGFSF